MLDIFTCFISIIRIDADATHIIVDSVKTKYGFSSLKLTLHFGGESKGVDQI